MATPEVDFTFANKYHITSILGKGAFGTVYRATDTALDREVALKVLHTVLSADPTFVSRFRTEAKAIANLRHPNIVGIYELGEDDGRQFIAMELMPGGTLQDRLTERGLQSFAEALAVLRQVASGLEAAHQQGLVHRDVKPANILFGQDGQAAISDFGLVRAAQLSANSASSSSGGAGTPFYKAPEVWRGKPPASPATDVYALGCVTFEMLTGRLLFSGETPDEIITKHLIEGPDFGPDWPPAGAPAGLAAVVARAVARNPNDRFPTAGVFGNALDGLRPDKPMVVVMDPNQSTQLAPTSQPTRAPMVAPTSTQQAVAPARDESDKVSKAASVADPTSEPPSDATIIVSPSARGDAIGPSSPVDSSTTATAAEVAYQPIRAVQQPAVASPFRQPGPPGPIVPPTTTPDNRPNAWVWAIGLLLLGCLGLGLVVLVGVYAGIRMTAANPNSTIARSLTAVSASTDVAASTRGPAATEAPAATSPAEASSAATLTAAPTFTAAPTVTPTKTPPPPTALVIPAGMVLAPAGTFNMGSTAFGDTAPVHPVTLDAFYIDRFEVTNDNYHQCVTAGACTNPVRRSTDTRGKYYDDPAFGSFPVSNVNWQQAQNYCQWQNKRLPTEAEWEYAATGGDGRRYPWGDKFDASLVPMAANDTVKIGSFPGNASPLGAEDMAGNVVEWVSDWYSQDYYATSPTDNPTGPPTGAVKVTRGGAFGNADPTIYLAARRFTRTPNLGDVDIGFRCARAAPTK